MRNHNDSIMQLLPKTTIRFGWARSQNNPADLTSKMFLTPSEIINSSFYRHVFIEYLSHEPYDHVFLKVTKSGEKYFPPPSSSGVVSLNNCSVCQIPETCLVFMANATRIQPPRACNMRTATRVKQQLQDSVEESIIEKKIRDIAKSETK